VKSGQEDETWLLGLQKYFQVHKYTGNMKAKVPIYNMNARASTWWEHLIKVKKKINERKITWKQFEKHFQ
jgi:hypothetical protein